MAIKFFSSIIFALIFIECRHNHTGGVIIESQKLFDSIPSASGIAVKGDSAFIVCDDGTAIYPIHLTNFGQNKIPIRGLTSNEYREPKPLKHDFESACFIRWQNGEYLMSFGSGSNSGSRDSLLLVNTADYGDQKIISLHEFYRNLQLLTHTDSTQWNIEGVTVIDSLIVLANRGNNLLITCNGSAFISYLLKVSDSLPAIKFFKLKLPSIGKYEARLSGVCTIDASHILFCASVEDTPDWTKDGPVLGSYFGICSLKDRKVNATYLMEDKDGKPLKEKIESVDVLKQSNTGDILFIAVGDNDNGSSKLWQLKLHY